MTKSATDDVDDWDKAPDVTDIIKALDRRILEATRVKSPAMRLAFDGVLGVDDINKIHDQLHGIEIIAPHPRSPIEFLKTHPKEPLEQYEATTAERFLFDFNVAMKGSVGVVNYEHLGMYDTATTREHRAAGYYGRGGAHSHSTGDVSVARLEAMQRRGALAGAHRMSFWLLEAVICFDLWPKDIAKHLGWEVRRVGWRFREALMDAAGFYRIHAQGPRHSEIRSVCALGSRSVEAEAAFEDLAAV